MSKTASTHLRHPGASRELLAFEVEDSGLRRNDETISHKFRTTDYLESRFDLTDPNDPVVANLCKTMAFDDARHYVRLENGKFTWLTRLEPGMATPLGRPVEPEV